MKISNATYLHSNFEAWEIPGSGGGGGGSIFDCKKEILGGGVGGALDKLSSVGGYGYFLELHNRNRTLRAEGYKFNVFLYFQPYVCNLNPLHCKRPKQSKGG